MATDLGPVRATRKKKSYCYSRLFSTGLLTEDHDRQSRYFVIMLKNSPRMCVFLNLKIFGFSRKILFRAAKFLQMECYVPGKKIFYKLWPLERFKGRLLKASPLVPRTYTFVVL